jgi:SAM-dependent methyltransferase
MAIGLKNLLPWYAETTRPFDHQAFADRIFALAREGRHEAAAEYLLAHGPEMLTANLSPKQKLIHLLFLPRIIQAGLDSKHGYQKLRRKMKSAARLLEQNRVAVGGGFLELGCGVHDPLAMATGCYLNGFEPCIGVDIAPPAYEPYSAMSMYDVLANVHASPQDYCLPGVVPETLLARARDLDIEAFARGDFAAGFAKLGGKVQFQPVDVAHAQVEPSSLTLLMSFAVLEHVSDIDAVCAALFSFMRPGGLVFHFIDLVDHRSYWNAVTATGERYGPLSFLAEEHAPANMNRLRAPEIAEAHRRAGFEILKDERRRVDVPEDIRKNMVERFRRMPLEDAATIKQNLLVRRPH